MRIGGVYIDVLALVLAVERQRDISIIYLKSTTSEYNIHAIQATVWQATTPVPWVNVD
jgi:hypothetical protein